MGGSCQAATLTTEPSSTPAPSATAVATPSTRISAPARGNTTPTPKPQVPASPDPLGGLNHDQTLRGGWYLKSQSGQYLLTMQGDGDLVLSTQGMSLWRTNTGGHPGATVTMEQDGNLLLSSPTGQLLWASNTSGHPGAYLWVGADGNIEIDAASGGAIWATGTINAFLSSGQSLVGGWYLMSINGACTLSMLANGDLVLYANPGQRQLWNANTVGNPGDHVTMQPDGNLVVYTPAGRPLWSSNTAGHPAHMCPSPRTAISTLTRRPAERSGPVTRVSRRLLALIPPGAGIEPAESNQVEMTVTPAAAAPTAGPPPGPARRPPSTAARRGAATTARGRPGSPGPSPTKGSRSRGGRSRARQEMSASPI